MCTSSLLRVLSRAAVIALAIASPALAESPVTPLVSTAWLKARLGSGGAQSDLVVLDIRSAIDGGGHDA